ncbi:MAG TPA: hypothetical protein DCW43_04310 [Clostridiales bacterium]|nr:hypothetical protein [Clostridiales bacterium]
MTETKYISLKQYRIFLSFALLLIFTTGTVPAFCSAVAQTVIFVLINLIVFSRISNKRVCWGIFLSVAALMGEGMYFLSPLLPKSFYGDGFFLLPASAFLFLLAPMFDYINEERKISAVDSLHGILFYVISGILISVIRELFGQASLLGVAVPSMSRWQIRLFSHTSGSALLVLGIMVILAWWKNMDEDERWILETSEKKSKIYRPISAKTEKRFILLLICILVYDLLFGAIGAAVIYAAPASYNKPAHIVALSALTSLLLLTLLIKVFRLSDALDEYFYVPLLTVVMTSTPLIVYTRYLDIPDSTAAAVKIAWWAALMVGVWLFTTVVVAYIRSIHERLMFGKQPKCLEGIPLVVLHVLLAMIVFMPWTDVLARL